MTNRPNQDARPRNQIRPRLWLPAAAVLMAWLVSGFYIVQGNQQGVVRRFGRLVRNDAGRVQISPSGLRWDLPWPLAQVDRVNTHEVRTLTR